MCLTFLFRGHGSSIPVDELMDLINDKSQLVRDLQSAMDFLNTHIESWFLETLTLE